MPNIQDRPGKDAGARASLSTGEFPNIWKCSYVTAIWKSGDKDDVENYRPISGIDCLAKTLESIVVDFLMPTFKNIISEHQHGFIPKRSTQTNLCLYTNYLATALDSGTQVDSVYFDFSKAFDRVNHQVLIAKLTSYGISGSLLRWFASYLAERYQIVRFNGLLSDTITVTSGVPQGSHLGPILFLIFINDLSVLFKNARFLFYADDLKIYKEIINDRDCADLQHEINKITDWCTLNNMKINLSKCKVISFTRKKKPILFNYSLSNERIPRVTLINDLGVIFDTELRFREHINNIISKSFRMAGFIMRTCFNFTNINVLMILYYALVRSHLEYCCIAWSPFYKIHSARIERVQSKFVSFLFRKLRIDYTSLSYTQRLSMLGLDSLETRRIFLTILFGHKIIRNELDCPDLLESINFRVPPRNTRLAAPFLTHKYRTDIGHNSPTNRVMSYLNTYVPNEYQYEWSLPRFKSYLKRLLLH